MATEAKEGLPSLTIDAARLVDGIGVLDLFAMTDLCATNSDARRLVTQGGACINEKKITDSRQIIDSSWIEGGELMLKAGKKRYFRIIVQ